MDAIEAMLTRHSIRGFDVNLPIEQEKLEKIIACGMAAPTAMEQWAWRFLTITDHDLMVRMSDYSKWWKMLKISPLCIVVMTDPSVRDGLDEELQVISSALAAENMLLAAHAQGIGGCYLGIGKGDEKYDEFIELVGIPSPYRVMGVLAFGYPTKGYKPFFEKTHYDDSKWIREHF